VVKQELNSRLVEVKTVAMMEMREKMGAVELVNWWKNFIGNIPPNATFKDLDQDTQGLLLNWEEVLRRDANNINLK
jgi:hypothetical protein